MLFRSDDSEIENVVLLSEDERNRKLKQLKTDIEVHLKKLISVVYIRLATGFTFLVFFIIIYLSGWKELKGAGGLIYMGGTRFDYTIT